MDPLRRRDRRREAPSGVVAVVQDAGGAGGRGHKVHRRGHLRLSLKEASTGREMNDLMMATTRGGRSGSP